MLQPDILVALAADDRVLDSAFASLWRHSRMMRRDGTLSMAGRITRRDSAVRKGMQTAILRSSAEKGS